MKANPCKTCKKIPDAENIKIINKKCVHMIDVTYRYETTIQLKCCNNSVKETSTSYFFGLYRYTPLIKAWNKLNPIEDSK